MSYRIILASYNYKFLPAGEYKSVHVRRQHDKDSPRRTLPNSLGPLSLPGHEERLAYLWQLDSGGTDRQ